MAPTGGQVKFSRQCRDAATYLSISHHFHDFYGSYMFIRYYRAIFIKTKVILVIQIKRNLLFYTSRYINETEKWRVLSAEKRHRELAGTRDDSW